MKHMFQTAVIVAGLALAISCVDSRADFAGDFKTARGVVDEKYRTEVFYVRGEGTSGRVSTWDFYFYDPGTPNKLRLVTVVDGKINKVIPSTLKKTVTPDRLFDPSSQAPSLDNALAAAAQYAKDNEIAYNQVRVVLRRPEPGEAPTWLVEMRQDGLSRGVVYTSAPSGRFVRYTAVKKSGGGGGAAGFFKDVENTFLGIGGDLEEFFTGDRTVDQ
jgi:hypothetical protein